MRLLDLVIAVTLLWPQSAVQGGPALTAVPYRTIVDTYRRISVKEIDQILSAPIPALTAAVNTAVSSTSAWTWEETRGAAMLHTDAAVRALRLKDTATAESHLLLARRLLDRTVSITPSQQDFVWRWLRHHAAHGHATRREGNCQGAARILEETLDGDVRAPRVH